MQRNLDEIIELLRKNYEKAKKSKYVQRPLAWALYQTWKTVDRVIDVQPTADVTDMNVGGKPPCKVCERITEANKDIFWVFARTHQPGTKEEFLRIQYEETRFCPVCGREITKEGKT